MIKRALEISEQLAAEHETISAHYDLAANLYNVAMHEMTPAKEKKPLLERALKIAQMLLDETQEDSYRSFVDLITSELKSL